MTTSYRAARLFARSATGAIAAAVLIVPLAALGQSANDTQTKIDAQSSQIAQLNDQIAQYQAQLDATAQKKQTLVHTLNHLDVSIQKSGAQVAVTQHQIASTQLQVYQLSNNIADAQASIEQNSAALGQSLRALQEEESRPLVVQLLSSTSIAQLWSDLIALDTIQGAVRARIGGLSSAKQNYAVAKATTVSKQEDLIKQRGELKVQQGSLLAQKASKGQLLAQTKSQESTYQNIIAEKKAQAAQLQAALADLKSQYNVTVNPNSYPAPFPGLFAWPIDGTIRITQYFGSTPFAQVHPTLYSGHGHDGLDIAAPIGTPVHSALAGVVLATGDTDKVRTSKGQCYSFGKWVMIKHADGLNTMYAHLSEIDVSEGQQLATGQLLGYSGETGYATGPHLHFGVYVSAVTKIIPLGEATKGVLPCAYAVMPVPPVSGYLNPLNYLPPLP